MGWDIFDMAAYWNLPGKYFQNEDEAIEIEPVPPVGQGEEEGSCVIANWSDPIDLKVKVQSLKIVSNSIHKFIAIKSS